MKIKVLEGSSLTVGDIKDLKILISNIAQLQPNLYYKTTKNAKKKYNIKQDETQRNVFDLTIYQKQNNPWGFDYNHYRIEAII